MGFSRIFRVFFAQVLYGLLEPKRDQEKATNVSLNITTQASVPAPNSGGVAFCPPRIGGRGAESPPGLGAGGPSPEQNKERGASPYSYAQKSSSTRVTPTRSVALTSCPPTSAVEPWPAQPGIPHAVMISFVVLTTAQPYSDTSAMQEKRVFWLPAR
jgi:hypothetical protein